MITIKAKIELKGDMIETKIDLDGRAESDTEAAGVLNMLALMHMLFQGQLDGISVKDTSDLHEKYVAAHFMAYQRLMTPIDSDKDEELEKFFGISERKEASDDGTSESSNGSE